MTVALTRPRIALVTVDDQQHNVPDLQRELPDLQPDFGSLRAAALGWKRRRLERGSQYESYLRYLDATIGDLLDSGRAEPAELAARAIVFFTGDVPSCEERRAVIEVHETTGANFYDLALAWSLGWSPIRAPHPARMPHPDDTALVAIVEQCAASAGATARLLVERAGLDVVDRAELDSYAALFGMALTGRCDCGHHLRGCTGCGRGCCFADHDVRSWDPYRCHLRPFVDQAIRGTAQKRIMGGAFAASMLFRILEREGKLLCRTVEWGRCEDCGRAFEGLRCPEPHPVRAGSVRREPRKNQLVRPDLAEGGHTPIRRWLCANCIHLFGAAGSSMGTAGSPGSAGRESDRTPACPRCRQLPARRMTVWARITPTAIRT